MKGFFASALLFAALFAPSALYAQEEIEVPMRVTDGRFVVTVVTEEGIEMDFALSTGNGATVLTETGAAVIENHGAPSMNGVWLNMDNHAVIPDSRLSDDGSILGMIGANTLNEFDILIDAPGKRLVLRQAGPPVRWNGMTLSEPSPLRVFHGVVLSFDAVLNGETFGAMLDIGTQVVVVNGGAKAKMGLGEAETLTLTAGGVTHASAPVMVQESEILGRFDPDNAGFAIVGAPIALDCALSISWVRREFRTCVR